MFLPRPPWLFAIHWNPNIGCDVEMSEAICVTMFSLSKKYDLGMFNTIIDVHYILYLVSYDAILSLW
jgi:hypothetical protein